ncbi:MAG: DNA polymerase III subunit beta [Candidatus Yonathbacteria bacterium RIFOXYC2_FULL_47_9]|nr:MAG: DNA polymerase III subunit beta [Candidatus Yonathbacteria bacterium RIFOXYC2_FULL_47_9]HAT68261.1 DNA polymerase III subunit beta [Candidatus Yonathbacteria bacterium]
MHITCNRESIQKYVANADRVTGKNLSLPILNSILLTASHKTLIIRATNLEVGVEFHIPADVKKEGSIALSGSLLANTLASIPDEQEISISADKGLCTITTKTKTLTIKGFLPDDFPTIPVIKDGEGFIMSAGKFIQGAKSVLMSAALSDIKPEISSVYLHQIADMVVFTSTDLFRLAEKKIKQSGVTISHGVIIPIKNITEIVRVLESTTEDISFLITKNQISCSGNSVYITSRVVQGVYPDYEQILPKSHTTEVVILKQDLLNTLKLSTLFSDKFNKVVIKIDPIKKTCIVSTKNTEVGDTESHLTTTLSGDPVEISLNGKHLFDCLGAIEKDSVVLEFNSSDKPAVIRGLGDNSFTYLTMPLTR